MMCLLKRVLPFTLTLILGLMLGSMLSPRPHSQMKCSYYSNQGSHSTPVIIRALPDATYTDAARLNRFEGTIYLYALCDANGTVSGIELRDALPYGLTEEAIRAARAIKFDPATEYGQPVSVWMPVEYHFMPWAENDHGVNGFAVLPEVNPNWRFQH